MTWVVALLGIVVLVILHELGHFVVAKAVGMRVERFSLFFPPKIVGVKRGETEYMIGAIPAGGYVKITGMSPHELNAVDLRVADRAYYMQSTWRRVVVILAGPGMNLLIAFIVFWAILASGSLSGDVTLMNLNPSIQTVQPTTTVGSVDRGMPAQGKLQAGDRILAIDGHHVSVASAVRVISAHRCAAAQTEGCVASTPARLTVRRNGRVVDVVVYPRYNREAGRMLVGFGFGAMPKQFGVAAAAGAAVQEMWKGTTNLVSGLGRALTSSHARKQLHTVVGIEVIAQEAVAAGPGYALVIIAFISLVLAVVNLFPFLPLDGGHVLWAVTEKLRGHRVSINAMWRFSTIGLVLFAFLFLNGLHNDITHLAG